MSATLGNGNITFGDGTVQSTSASMLGMGQGYSDVTSSRAKSTTYTNSTGKPIFVHVSCGNAFQQSGYLYINGVLADFSVEDTYARNYVAGIVPDGGTYYVTFTNQSLYHWCELR